MMSRMALHPPEYPSFGVAVNQRRHDIHEQDGVGDPFRIAPLETDQDDQKSAADAEDDPPHLRNRAGHPVGGHEERPQEKPAGQEMEERIPDPFPFDRADNRRQEKHRSEKAARDAPVDMFAVQEVQSAQKDGQGAGLSDAAADIADKELGRSGAPARSPLS